MKEIGGALQAQGLKFGIAVSRFNDLFTKQLVQGAVDALRRHGADEGDITLVWVPGAYELPLALQRMAASGRYNALIALGAVIQGATPHAGLIGSQVARALVQLAMSHDVPVIDGVVTADNLDQAIERCGTKSGNRGWNAAVTAIEMANLMQQLSS